MIHAKKNKDGKKYLTIKSNDLSKYFGIEHESFLEELRFDHGVAPKKIGNRDATYVEITYPTLLRMECMGCDDISDIILVFRKFHKPNMIYK